MRRVTIAIVALSLLTIGLPAATAQSAYVSGGCNDASGGGGIGAPDPGVRATDTTDNDGDGDGDEADTGADAGSTSVDVVDALDTGNAALYLAQGVLWDGQGVTNNCDGGGWIGVFTGVQDVCYDGGVNGDDCQTTDGSGGSDTSPISDGD